VFQSVMAAVARVSPQIPYRTIFDVWCSDPEYDFPGTWGLLFDAGGDARVNGIPFDEGRTAPWKEGWIETDVNLGVHGLEEL